MGTAKVFGGRGSSRRSLVAGQPLIATTQWLAILRVKACTAFRSSYASATNHRIMVEVKLGGEALIEEGASTLNALSGLLDTTRMKAVAFKMVLVAVGKYAYRRPDDNVIVCPIGCLKP